MRSRTGSVNCEVEVEGGVIQKHANQMKPRSSEKQPTPDIELAMMELAISLPFLRRPRRGATRTPPEQGPREGKTGSIPPKLVVSPSSNTDDKSTEPAQPAQTDTVSDSTRVGLLRTQKQRKQLKTTPTTVGNLKPNGSTKRKATSPIERAKNGPRRR